MYNNSWRKILKIKLVLFLLFLQFNLYAVERFADIIEPGIYYMLDYPVNIRSQPNINSSVIGRLELHSQIEVIENMGNPQVIDGILQNWYKIRHNSLEGYIWGGFIARESFVFDDNGIRYYFYSRIRHSYRIYNRQNRTQYWDFSFLTPDDIFIYQNNIRLQIEAINDLWNRSYSNSNVGEYYSSEFTFFVRCVFFERNGNVEILIWGATSEEIRFTFSNGTVSFNSIWGP